VTICNWNANVGNCSFVSVIHIYLTCKCELQLEYCASNQIDGSQRACTPDHLRYIEIGGSDGVYRCYQFNYNKSDIIQSITTGYAGSLSMLFSVNKVDPIKNANLVNGLQVSFTLPTEVPDVFNETNYAALSVDTFFTLQKVNSTFVDGNPDISRWDAESSSVSLNAQISPSGRYYVAISVGYNILSTKVIAQQYSQDAFGVFADICGMLGLLSGVQILKILNFVWALPYSLIIRNWTPVQRSIT
jgi:hypothetical protein